MFVSGTEVIVKKRCFGQLNSDSVGCFWVYPGTKGVVLSEASNMTYIQKKDGTKLFIQTENLRRAVVLTPLKKERFVRLLAKTEIDRMSLENVILFAEKKLIEEYSILSEKELSVKSARIVDRRVNPFINDDLF